MLAHNMATISPDIKNNNTTTTTTTTITFNNKKKNLQNINNLSQRKLKQTNGNGSLTVCQNSSCLNRLNTTTTIAHWKATSSYHILKFNNNKRNSINSTTASSSVTSSLLPPPTSLSLPSTILLLLLTQLFALKTTTFENVLLAFNFYNPISHSIAS